MTFDEWFSAEYPTLADAAEGGPEWSRADVEYARIAKGNLRRAWDASRQAEPIRWQWRDPNGNWIDLVDATMYNRLKAQGAKVRALAIVEERP